MLETEICQQAQKLADFIKTKKFEPVTQRTPYYHMGATITDSVLQAGLNYRHVVYPRVLKLLTKFPNYKTTCDFIILFQTIPLSELIKWNNEKKLKLIQNISWLFFNNGIENESQLAIWLTEGKNRQQLIDLNGVGPKTIDYLKMLSGNQSIAIDRHLFSFLRLAGILTNSYREASILYRRAAELLHMNEFELDKKIWIYMSEIKA